MTTMDLQRTRRFDTRNRHGRRQQGFMLMETLFSMGVMSVGLLALAAVFSRGMLQLQGGSNLPIAKQKAVKAIESVFTSRDTRIISWAEVRNQQDNGIFLDGPQPIRVPGDDELVNTDDDGPIEQMILPGPDGLIGTADDEIISFNTFTREIEISDLNPNLREIPRSTTRCRPLSRRTATSARRPRSSAVGQIESATGPYGLITGSGFLGATVEAQSNRGGVRAGSTFYVLDVANGSVHDSYDVGDDAGKNNLKNALHADPTATGPLNTRFVDMAYIPDTEGNLWRFNISDVGGAATLSLPVKTYDANKEHPIFASLALVNVGGSTQYVPVVQRPVGDRLVRGRTAGRGGHDGGPPVLSRVWPDGGHGLPPQRRRGGGAHAEPARHAAAHRQYLQAPRHAVSGRSGDVQRHRQRPGRREAGPHERPVVLFRLGAAAARHPAAFREDDRWQDRRGLRPDGDLSGHARQSARRPAQDRQHRSTTPEHRKPPPHPIRVAQHTCAAVELHDAAVLHALCEVLVRGADEHLLHAVVRRGERVVGLEVNHRPHDHAQRLQGLFEGVELLEEHRVDPFASLVAVPQPVAERFDDVVSGNTQMGDALLEHRQDRPDHATDGADLLAVGGNHRGDRVEMTE